MPTPSARAPASVPASSGPRTVGVLACDAAGRPQLVNKVLQAWREEGHVGEQEPTLASAEPVYDDRGALLGAVATVTDVTRQRELEARLREAALHDALTGLPNRSLLLDRIGQVLTTQRRSGTPAALIYCDLDGFKHVDDTAGHAAGDAALLPARHGPAQRGPRR